MVTETTTAAPPTCEARTGFYPGEWSEMPLWCSSTVGLTSWTDRRGMAHRACRHHVAALRFRYPEATPEACQFCGSTSAIVDGRYVLLTFGGRLRVVCDPCVEQADDEPEDEDELDREGQPEFNGAFR